MPKEFLKKLAGASMSENEANKLKLKELRNELVKTGAGTSQSKQEQQNIMEELRSPKDISEVEKKVKNFTSRESARGAARGAAGEAVAGSVLTEIEKNRLKDAMPDYASGGEVVVGKGKDYIKDLL